MNVTALEKAFVGRSYAYASKLIPSWLLSFFRRGLPRFWDPQKMLGTPIWLNMRVPGPRLKNPSAIPGGFHVTSSVPMPYSWWMKQKIPHWCPSRTYTKHGPQVHGPPLWTRSMDPFMDLVHGLPLWTIPHFVLLKAEKSLRQRERKRQVILALISVDNFSNCLL